MLVYQRASFFACFKISFPSKCWFSFKTFDPFRAWLCLKNRLDHGTTIPFIGSSIDESSSQLTSNDFMAKRGLISSHKRPESAIFQAKRDGGLPAKSAKVALMARGKPWPSDDREQSVWIRWWFLPIYHWILLYWGKSTRTRHQLLLPCPPCHRPRAWSETWTRPKDGVPGDGVPGIWKNRKAWVLREFLVPSLGFV